MTKVIDTKDMNVPAFLPEMIANGSPSNGYWEETVIRQFETLCNVIKENVGADHWTIECLTEEPEFMHCDMTNNADSCHHVRINFLKEVKTVTTTPLMIESVDFEDACEALRSHGFVYEEGADYWFKEKAEPLQSIARTQEDYKKLWSELREIPVTGDELQESFLHFEKGALITDVWAWFDEKYEGGCYELLYGKKGDAE